MTKSKKLSFYWTKIGQSETFVQKKTSFSYQLFDKTQWKPRKKKERKKEKAKQFFLLTLVVIAQQ